LKHKAILLSSVSAVAASTAAVGGAYAQMPAVTGYTYSVQGSAIFSPGPSNESLDEDASNKISDGFGVVVQDHPGDVGYAGAATFGVEFNGGWDATFGLSANEFVTNTGSVTASSSVSFSGISGGMSTVEAHSVETEKTVFGFETADAEIGFTPVMTDGFNVRIFGGVRVLHFHSSDDFSGTGTESSSFTGGGSTFSRSATETFDDNFSSDFLGAGPRIGISASKRFDGSNFGISGSLAAAAIFGQQTDASSSSSSITFTSSFNGSTSTSAGPHGSHKTSSTYSKTVFDLQAQAGIDYYLTDTSKLTVGYQIEELTNVGEGVNSNVNKTIQGAFVKVSGSFN